MDKIKFANLYKGKFNERSSVACFDNIKLALEQQKIYSDLTFIGALATVNTEVTNAYLPITENLNYSASGLLATFPSYFRTYSEVQAYAYKPVAIANKVYANRIGNGNEMSGDGWKYRGRGYIQLTGKQNYKYYGDKIGVDLVNNPDLALDPVISAKILAVYFKDRKINEVCNTRNWTLARKLVNGGTNGLDRFLQVVNVFLTLK